MYHVIIVLFVDITIISDFYEFFNTAIWKKNKILTVTPLQFL